MHVIAGLLKCTTAPSLALYPTHMDSCVVEHWPDQCLVHNPMPAGARCRVFLVGVTFRAGPTDIAQDFNTGVDPCL